ncbi:transcription initiation factor TFIID subunit 5 [Culex quinquefasciatus]|uniref:Transcription initiation factor TFIID subunit 5 n=1 Tax=Culex quinquefasciatus TaxID=7176 RepID=B0WAT2_CULQU|nr:transcription initiation factor TFIID subunit 5 [Culex quinquefasciatus]EDS41798.1 transcription initiation factor TFIID subunit 5 [Culex quinquefasciatus]|eukprot:XP_001845816.1 transcription initiation factor TFIID subunit 5 [Culex quinquefasciatus]
MAQSKTDLLAVLAVLKKYNLKGTEDLLKKEASLSDIPENAAGEADVNSVLAAYKSEGDPDIYENSYMDLRRFVEESLDIYRHELGLILYPVVVHMYIELVYNGHEEQAKKFISKFGPEQEYYYQDELAKLAMITKKDQMSGNDLTDTFKSNSFTIRISRDTLSLLKRHLHEKKASVILNIVNEHLYFDLYEGVARNKAQCDATTGAMVGEARRTENKVKVYYGLLKEPDVQTLVQAPPEEDDDMDPDAPDKPKKKKPKKDPLFSKKSKTDPNAPPLDRIPLPKLKDVDKMEKIKALRESSKRVNLGPDCLPSVCMYTLLNANYTVTCADICEDSSLIAIGFSDSSIKVWSLSPVKLREMKGADLLKEIDRDADDVLIRMLDDRKAETSRVLHGHSGPVYRTAFAPDRTMMLSCSEDCTIRLWSLHTWTCVVVYKGHQFPVWDVRFSPHGHYFLSCSHDKSARLWSTDSHQPLRIFAGHLSDVDVCIFHPNSNYVATGSSDRTVRLWDVPTGNHLRLMTGHKAPIHSLAFSICGRYLATGSADCRVLIWDLAHGHLLAALTGHSASVHALCFSRDGTVLATGGLDCCLKLWDFSKLCEDISGENVNVSHNPDVRDGEPYLMRSFPTKQTPFLTLHFTRRNLLLGVGMFEGSAT